MPRPLKSYSQLARENYMRELKANRMLHVDDWRGLAILRPSSFLPSDFLDESGNPTVFEEATCLAPHAIQKAYHKIINEKTTPKKRLQAKFLRVTNQIDRLTKRKDKLLEELAKFSVED